jgi:hypothetical protein
MLSYATVRLRCLEPIYPQLDSLGSHPNMELSGVMVRRTTEALVAHGSTSGVDGSNVVLRDPVQSTTGLNLVMLCRASHPLEIGNAKQQFYNEKANV